MTPNFLYENAFGRFLLKLLTRSGISRLVGKYMDSSLSKGRIKKFIKNNGIDMSDFEEREFKSFNDFFTRSLKDGAREVPKNPDLLISPCDSLLSVYSIDEDTCLSIKGSQYTVEEILQNKSLAESFKGGFALVFRLTVTDYHRYIYFDSGTKEKNNFIQGILHTVQPIAQTKFKIYKTNSREYSILHTENFGDAVQMEVGAMMVGRIVNHMQEGSFKRGEEKGKFEFGGSTCVLFLQKDKVMLNPCFKPNSEQETQVKLGEQIGFKL